MPKTSPYCNGFPVWFCPLRLHLCSSALHRCSLRFCADKMQHCWATKLLTHVITVPTTRNITSPTQHRRSAAENHALAYLICTDVCFDLLWHAGSGNPGAVGNHQYPADHQLLPHLAGTQEVRNLQALHA